MWRKCARIPDNAEYVTWQFPCLNPTWCQEGLNRSILGKHWTIHSDKPVLPFNFKNTCKTGLLENANLIKSISSVEIRSGFPEKRQKLVNLITLPGLLSLLLCSTTWCYRAPPQTFTLRIAVCLLLVLAPAKILLMASQVMSPDRFWSGLTVALRRWKLVLSIPHTATSAAPRQRHPTGWGRSAWLTWVVWTDTISAWQHGQDLATLLCVYLKAKAAEPRPHLLASLVAMNAHIIPLSPCKPRAASCAKSSQSLPLAKTSTRLRNSLCDDHFFHGNFA